MIKHVVAWKLKESALGKTKQENAAELKQRLMSLVGVIGEIRQMEVGIDCTGSEKNYDACLVAVFDSLEDLAAYKVDPRHVAVSAFCKEIRESRIAVDWEI